MIATVPGGTRVGITFAASIPLVLPEASRGGRLASGSLLLMRAVAGGSTSSSLALRWTGEGGGSG